MPNLRAMSVMDSSALPSMPSERCHKPPQKPPTGRAGLLAQGSLISYSSCPFEIGGLGCWNGQFFNAVIDEVKLYDRALTADEVQAIFNDS